MGLRRGAMLAMLLWLGAAVSARAEVTNKIDKLDLPTNLWFEVGEELVYKVYWGVIPVGYVTIKTEWADFQGRQVLAIRYRAASNKVLSKIYPVESSIESLIDPVTFTSIRFIKNSREGRRRSNEITTFDYTLLTGTWFSLTKDKSKTFKLEPETRDLVAFLYALRASAFARNETRQYRVMADDDIYDLWIRVKDAETVKLPVFGKVSSLRVEPEAAFNGMFVRKGKVTAWVTDDARRFVTRVVATLPVVDVDVVLYEVRGPGDDSWIKAMTAAGRSTSTNAAPPKID